jgi:hypothetical protein
MLPLEKNAVSEEKVCDVEDYLVPAQEPNLIHQNFG